MPPQITGNIGIAYLWFANFRYGVVGGSASVDYKFTLDGVTISEPAWPTKYSQCTADRAFIAHYIKHFGNGTTTNPGDRFIDYSHGGIGDSAVGTSKFFWQGQDNPVGYADGHVKYILKTRIKPRARQVYGTPPYLIYYY